MLAWFHLVMFRDFPFPSHMFSLAVWVSREEISPLIKNLPQVCTREILHSLWCVEEMTTARLHSIDTILVIFPNFEDPSHAPEMAQLTYWWLGTRSWNSAPAFH